MMCGLCYSLKWFMYATISKIALYELGNGAHEIVIDEIEIDHHVVIVSDRFWQLVRELVGLDVQDLQLFRRKVGKGSAQLILGQFHFFQMRQPGQIEGDGTHHHILTQIQALEGQEHAHLRREGPHEARLREVNGRDGSLALIVDVFTIHARPVAYRHPSKIPLPTVHSIGPRLLFD